MKKRIGFKKRFIELLLKLSILNYKELCLIGAKLFEKEAKLRGEKPIRRGVLNADPNCKT